jgi:hypothetical protein
MPVSLIVLSAVVIGSPPARAAPEYDIGVSEQELFEALDPEFPGLEGVLQAHTAGNLTTAKRRLAAYLRGRTLKTWVFGPHEERTEVPFGDASLRGVRDMLARRGTFTDEWWLDNGELDWLKDPSHGNVARQYFWEALGRAYWASGRDEAIAKLWVAILRSWLRQCPKSADNQAYWNTLVTGIRMRSSWPTAFHHFLLSPSFTDDDIILYLRSTIEQTRHLRSNHRRTGNWLTFSMVGLYTSGVVFPELKEAADWREYALATALADLERGYLPDGMGVELSPGYHNLFYNYLRMHDLALATDRDDDPNVRALAERCERLFEPYVALCAPDRTLPKYQDGGLVRVPERLTDAASRYPHREDFGWLATGGEEGQPPAFRSALLPYAGYFALRSGWEPDANYLGFDAGPIGWKHAHQDKLNLVMWAYGRLLLLDPGRGDYSDTPLSNYAADTFSHSTVLVDHRPQRRRWSTPDPSQMPYQPVADIRWRTTETADFAYGVYDGAYGMPGPSQAYPYWEGTNFYQDWVEPATHHRRIAFHLPDLFVVADTLAPKDGRPHEYDLRWQLDTTSWRTLDDGLAAITTDERVPNLAVVPLARDGLAVTGTSGQAEPEMLGWKYYTKPEPATTLQHRKSGAGAVRFVTLLLPLRPDESFAIGEIEAPDAETWRVALGDGRTLRVTVPSDPGDDLQVKVDHEEDR